MRMTKRAAAAAAALALACGLAASVGAAPALAADPANAKTPQAFLDAAASKMKVTECSTSKYSKHCESREGTVWLAIAYGSSWDDASARMEKIELKLKMADKHVGDRLESGDAVKVSLHHHDSEKKGATLAQSTYATKVMADKAQGITVKLKVKVPAHYAAYKSASRNAQWSSYGHRLNLNGYSNYAADTVAKNSLLAIGHEGGWHTETLKVQVNLESCGIESQACDFKPLSDTGLRYAPGNEKLESALSGSFNTTSGLNYSSSGEVGCAIAALFKKQKDTLKLVNKACEDGGAGKLTYNGKEIAAGGSKAVSDKACQKASKKAVAEKRGKYEFAGWKVTRTAVKEKVAGKSVKKTSSGTVEKTASNNGGTARYTFCDSTSSPSSPAYAWCGKCDSAFFFGCGGNAAKWAAKHTGHRDRVSTENHGSWSGSVTTVTATWNSKPEGKIEYYLDGAKLTGIPETELPTFLRCDVSGSEVAESADCEFETGTGNLSDIEAHMESAHNHHASGHPCEHTYSGYYCSYSGCQSYTTSRHTHNVVTGYRCSKCGSYVSYACYHEYLSCTNKDASHKHTSSCYSSADFATTAVYGDRDYCSSATLYEHYRGNLGTPNTDWSCDKESRGCTWSFEQSNADGSAAAAQHESDYDYFAKDGTYTKMYRTLSLEQAVSRAVTEGNLAAGTEVEGDERLVGAWYLDGSTARFETYASREAAQASMGLGTCQGHSSIHETECGHSDGSGMAVLSRAGGDELEEPMWEDGTLKLYAFTAVAVDGYADYAYIDSQYGAGEGVGDGVTASSAPGDSHVHTDWAVVGNTYKVTEAMCEAAEAKRAGSCMDWADYVGEDYWFTDPECSDDSDALDDGGSDDDTDGSAAASSRFPAAGAVVDGPLDLFTRNKVQVSIDYSDNTVSMAARMASLKSKDADFNVYTLASADGTFNVVKEDGIDFKGIKHGAVGLMASAATGQADLLGHIYDEWMPKSAYGRTEASSTAAGRKRGVDDGHADGDGGGEFHWYGDVIDGGHLEAQAPGEDLYYLSSSGYVRKVGYNGLFADRSASEGSGPVQTGSSLPWNGAEGQGVEANTVLYMDWDDAVYDGIQGS